MRGVRIIGSGLIGTSIALGLSAKGIHVQMVDSDEGRKALAQDLVGSPEIDEIDLVVFALPTSLLSQVISEEFHLNPKAVFIDVGSIKTKPLENIQVVAGLAKRFCGTHPMAGREIGGPEAARADLFVGRAWILTPHQDCDNDVLPTVRKLVDLLGATPVEMSAQEHDSAVALISHLPQITSSLLAQQLEGQPQEWLAIAGQGLRDTTRIAASDPRLWREIISMNRERIRPMLVKMERGLQGLISSLDDDLAIEEFVAAGQRGRAAIPGKHGDRPRDYTYLPIVIEDKPGQLAALFNECANAQVNVEDLSIEHSPGQFTGLITLALSKSDAEHLSSHLESRGWNVHAPR